MLLNGRPTRTIWPEGGAVVVLDQCVLPHRVQTLTLRSAADAVRAIADMAVRGAPLIGVAGAYGVALQARGLQSDAVGLERETVGPGTGVQRLAAVGAQMSDAATPVGGEQVAAASGEHALGPRQTGTERHGIETGGCNVMRC